LSEDVEEKRIDMINFDKVREVKSKIETWLKEEGYFFKEDRDPQAYYDFVVQLGQTVFRIVQPARSKDFVFVVLQFDFPPEQLEAIKNWTDDQRSSLVNQIELNLVPMTDIHEIQIYPKPPKEVLGFALISRHIYYDGLTKDRLMDLFVRLPKVLYLVRVIVQDQILSLQNQPSKDSRL
jgi:hypothetical protein